MKRSLRRHIEHAINQTWPRHGDVTIAILFPQAAFPHAPTWTPGPDFHPTAGEYAWRRDNPDGTVTAVVAGVPPKEMPALDGGPWTEPEVWTVTAPATNPFMDSGSLWDKPHRITWTLDDPDAVIHRAPYHSHPAATVSRYWETFETTWGFRPRTLECGQHPFSEGTRWLALTCQPGWADEPGEDDLLNITVDICRRFGAKARVYPWKPRMRYAPVREDQMNLVTLTRRLRPLERIR
jgi:hypothetical protein